MSTTAKIKIQVKKNPNETNPSLVRRFSRRIQESGNLRQAKSLRYNKRPLSKFNLKKSALHKVAKRKEYERLKKLGKVK